MVKKKDLFFALFLIISIGFLIYLILQSIFTSAKDTFKYLGLENVLFINTFLIISFGILIIFFYGNQLDKLLKIKFFERVNIWAKIWIFLFILGIFILLNLLTIYPGQPDIREYNVWYINEGIDYKEANEIGSGFSNVKLTSMNKNRYFVENDIIKINFSFYNEKYYISGFFINQIDRAENLTEPFYYPCSNEKNCYDKIRLKLNTNKIEIIPETIKNDGSFEIKKPVVMNIYTDALTKTEANNRRKEEFLFIGSLLSIILFASAGFVNQLRQIWNDKKN